jgi:hypothetical protein
MSRHGTSAGKAAKKTIRRADTMARSRPEPGSWADRSRYGFALRHDWSLSTYCNRKRKGLGPRETQSLPGGRVSISEQAEREYDLKYSQPLDAAE